MRAHPIRNHGQLSEINKENDDHRNGEKMTHGNGGCAHHHAAGIGERRLAFSLLGTILFVAIEIGVGLWANSLVLISDAGHNFTDAMALALSWYGLRVARRPANAMRTYGYHRVGILAAFINSVTLCVLAIWLLKEAFLRLLHPEPVAGVPVIIVAAIALLVNTVIAVGLHRASQHSLNVRSAFLHMVGDAVASIGVILAGVLIAVTKWTLIDPLVSIGISGLIAWSSWGIIRDSLNVLLEGTPRGLNVEEMTRHMLAVPGVSDVHDLHVWTIGDGMTALSCHLIVDKEKIDQAPDVVRETKQMLATRYSVGHATIETECGGCGQPAEPYCRLEPLPNENAHDHHEPDHHECDHMH